MDDYVIETVTVNGSDIGLSADIEFDVEVEFEPELFLTDSIIRNEYAPNGALEVTPEHRERALELAEEKARENV